MISSKRVLAELGQIKSQSCASERPPERRVESGSMPSLSRPRGPMSTSRGNEVIVYSLTGCRHCLASKAAISEKGLSYREVLVDEYPFGVRDWLTQKTGKTSLPQIFFGSLYVGGNDELQRAIKDSRTWSLLLEELNGDVNSEDDLPWIPPNSERVSRTGDSNVPCSKDPAAELIDVLRDSVDVRIFCKAQSLFCRHRAGTFTGKQVLQWISSRDGGESFCSPQKIADDLVSRRFISPVGKEEGDRERLEVDAVYVITEDTKHVRISICSTDAFYGVDFSEPVVIVTKEKRSTGSGKEKYWVRERKEKYWLNPSALNSGPPPTCRPVEMETLGRAIRTTISKVVEEFLDSGSQYNPTGHAFVVDATSMEFFTAPVMPSDRTFVRVFDPARSQCFFHAFPCAFSDMTSTVSSGGGGGMLGAGGTTALGPSPAGAPSGYALHPQTQTEVPDHEEIYRLVEELREPETREAALVQLSKKRDVVNDFLGPVLWHSFGTIPILLHEIVSIYPWVQPPRLSATQSNRVCNALALLQTVASHPETRTAFLQANIPLYLYAFLHMTSQERPFEYLRLTSLGVIGSLVKTDEREAVDFLLNTEIIPLCLQIMEKGSDLSKTVATFIVSKILLDPKGLNYICQTYERFSHVAMILGKMVLLLAKEPSLRLLKHVIRCYLSLSENNRAREALRQCIPDPLKDDTFQVVLKDDRNAKAWLMNLHVNAPENQRRGLLAFFINVYNSLVIHATVVRGKPSNDVARYRFFTTSGYIIGGYWFTLDDIENGILRGNRKSPLALFSAPFKEKDSRCALIVRGGEPRIHFALNCGAKSCPPVRTYSGQ
ncbi:unnamed protein product, partial [Cyprideis torosa]